MDWLFHAFWLALGLLGGFLIGGYVIVKEADRRVEYWRSKAIDLQVQVHELQGR